MKTVLNPDLKEALRQLKESAVGPVPLDEMQGNWGILLECLDEGGASDLSQLIIDGKFREAFSFAVERHFSSIVRENLRRGRGLGRKADLKSIKNRLWNEIQILIKKIQYPVKKKSKNLSSSGIDLLINGTGYPTREPRDRFDLLGYLESGNIAQAMALAYNLGAKDSRFIHGTGMIFQALEEHDAQRSKQRLAGGARSGSGRKRMGPTVEKIRQEHERFVAKNPNLKRTGPRGSWAQVGVELGISPSSVRDALRDKNQ